MDKRLLKQILNEVRDIFDGKNLDHWSVDARTGYTLAHGDVLVGVAKIEKKYLNQ